MDWPSTRTIFIASGTCRVNAGWRNDDIYISNTRVGRTVYGLHGGQSNPDLQAKLVCLITSASFRGSEATERTTCRTKFVTVRCERLLQKRSARCCGTVSNVLSKGGYISNAGLVALRRQHVRRLLRL